MCWSSSADVTLESSTSPRLAAVCWPAAFISSQKSTLSRPTPAACTVQDCRRSGSNTAFPLCHQPTRSFYFLCLTLLYYNRAASTSDTALRTRAPLEPPNPNLIKTRSRHLTQHRQEGPAAMIRFILVQNRQGKTRLSKFYVPYDDDEKIRLRGEVHRIIAPRDQKYQSNFVEVSPTASCLALCGVD